MSSALVEAEACVPRHDQACLEAVGCGSSGKASLSAAISSSQNVRVNVRTSPPSNAHAGAAVLPERGTAAALLPARRPAISCAPMRLSCAPDTL
eukprot:365011-Chlamydomonas_euryale.AAC.33